MSDLCRALLRELRAAVTGSSGLCRGWCEISMNEMLAKPGDSLVPTGIRMCALGEMARARGIATYLPALRDAEEGAAAGSLGEAEAMGFPALLAREIVSQNDRHIFGEEPAERRARMLRWIDSLLVSAGSQCS